MDTNLIKSPPYRTKPAAKCLYMVFALGIVSIISTIILYMLNPPLVLDTEAKQAVRQMKAAMLELKLMRHSLNIPLTLELDPALSGLIGVDYSDITSTLGDLRAKQTSLNPMFSGILVMWLKQIGVKEGDTVDLSFSGSFPALNLAAHCACDVLKLKTFIISSVGSSTYGANIPKFTWLDMEAHLFEKGLIHSRSRYASLGGIMDTGGGIDETGIDAGERAILRHGAIYLKEGTPRTVIPDVERRMRLYKEKGTPKAFINVGGNVTSLGWVSEAALLNNGLISRLPACSSPQRGTIFRMFELGIPVIHLINIERLAADYHLPIAPTDLHLDSWLTTNLSTARNQHLNELGLLFFVWFVLSLGLIFYENYF